MNQELVRENIEELGWKFVIRHEFNPSEDKTDRSFVSISDIYEIDNVGTNGAFSGCDKIQMLVCIDGVKEKEIVKDITLYYLSWNKGRKDMEEYDEMVMFDGDIENNIDNLKLLMKWCRIDWQLKIRDKK